MGYLIDIQRYPEPAGENRIKNMMSHDGDAESWKISMMREKFFSPLRINTGRDEILDLAEKEKSKNVSFWHE